MQTKRVKRALVIAKNLIIQETTVKTSVQTNLHWQPNIQVVMGRIVVLWKRVVANVHSAPQTASVKKMASASVSPDF